MDFGSIKNEFRAKLNGEKSALGYLVFEDSGISFHEDFSLSSPINLRFDSREIQSINFRDTSSDVYQPGFWKVFFLRVLAFARPKNWSNSSCEVEVEMMSGEFVFFEIEGLTSSEIRSRINQIVSGYF
jgi:hypothetical protein